MILPGFLFVYISFSSTFALLLALGFRLSSRDWTDSKKRRISRGFLFVGIFLFHYIYMNTNLLILFPHLYLYHLPIFFLFGPILCKLIYQFLDTEPPEWLEGKWNYGFFTLALLWIVWEVLFPSEARLGRIEYLQSRLLGNLSPEDLVFQLEPMAKFLAITGSIHLLLYILVPWVGLIRFFRLEAILTIASVRFVMILLGFVFLAVAGALVLGLFEIQIGLDMGLFFLATIPPLIYIVQTIYPNLFDEVKEAIREERKYKNSTIRNLDLNNIQSKLNNIFQTEKLYLEEGLKLNDVAGRLGITPHQLSEFINTRTGKTFQNWINGFRIQHACELLSSHTDWAVIRIAFESGFSSKSGFQDAFKKETGMTPSEYRKNLRSS